jgi:hypothetical protein
VQDYTRRQLTYRTDKLVAIQGVADAVADATSRQYFAGIWTDTPQSIIMGLLWASDAKNNGQRIEIAPSWSWASVETPVQWCGHWLCRPESRLQVLDLRNLGSPPSQASGELVLEATLRPAFTDDGLNFRLVAWPDETAQGDIDEASRSAAANPSWVLDSMVTPVSTDEKLAENTSVWFAEVVRGELHSQGHAKWVHCLMLTAHGARPDGLHFRRIGYSLWEESRWDDKAGLPERRKMKVVIQ